MLLLFVLWVGSAIILSEFDPELVLLLAELEEDEELDYWLLMAVASMFGWGHQLFAVLLWIVGWLAGLWSLDWVESLIG